MGSFVYSAWYGHSGHWPLRQSPPGQWPPRTNAPDSWPCYNQDQNVLQRNVPSAM